MQITVGRNELGAALAWAMTGCPRRPVVPVLGAMRVAVARGRLTLGAFDYEVTALAHVAGESARDGSVLVDGASLKNAVRALPKERGAAVRIVAGDDGLALECGPVTTQVPAMGAEAEQEYPQLPVMPPLAGIVAAGDFAGAVARVSAAAGRDGTLPALMCVALEMGAGLTMAATDRYRLAAETLEWAAADEWSATVALVPAAELAAFGKVAAGDVSVSWAADVDAGTYGAGSTAGGFAGFATADREMIVRARPGTFPKWRGLLPESVATTVTADSRALHAAVKRAGAVCGKRDRVGFEANGSIVLQPERDGVPCGAETVAGLTAGASDHVVTAFNPAYLASLIGGVDGPVVMGFNDPRKPARVTADSAPGFTALIMPMRNPA